MSEEQVSVTIDMKIDYVCLSPAERKTWDAFLGINYKPEQEVLLSQVEQFVKEVAKRTELSEVDLMGIWCDVN